MQAKVDTRNLAAQRPLERAGFGPDLPLFETEWSKGEWTTLRIYSLQRSPTEV